MTSLIIRHCRTDERGRQTSTLAQRTAAARASRDHHVQNPCTCALEACCSLYFVAKLTIHCSHRTSAKAHARAPCEHHHDMLRCMAKGWHAWHRYQRRAARAKRASPRIATMIVACGLVSELSPAKRRCAQFFSASIFLRAVFNGQ